MSTKKKVMYICLNCAKVVDTKDQKRHSRNCTVKKSPGLYEEPDVVSSSDEENEVENVVQNKEQNEGQEKMQTEEQDETTLIINAVRKRQPIWDNRMTKPDRSPKVIAELWLEVDEETGLTPGKAKAMWSVIRHRFSAERRRVEAGQSSAWPHYNPLLFLIATRQAKPQYPSPKVSTQKVLVPKQVTPKQMTPKQPVPKPAVLKVPEPKPTTPKILESKKKKEDTPRASNATSKATSNTASNHQQMLEGAHQLVPAPSLRSRTTRSNIETLYQPLVPSPSISMHETRKRELSIASSDSDVDVVEEINMNGGSYIQRHIENPIAYKRVCIRQLQETQVQNLDDDDDDDEIRRFCSYLEVMLRKMPKRHQEMFCEETLDHLATVNRKLRRSNF